MSDYDKAFKMLDQHYEIVDAEGLDRDGYHIAWEFIKRRISELEAELKAAKERERSFAVVIDAMLMQDASEAHECKFDSDLWERAMLVVDNIRTREKQKEPGSSIAEHSPDTRAVDGASPSSATSIKGKGDDGL